MKPRGWQSKLMISDSAKGTSNARTGQAKAGRSRARAHDRKLIQAEQSGDFRHIVRG